MRLACYQLGTQHKGLQGRGGPPHHPPVRCDVQATEEEAMRGFRVERKETREVKCEEALLYYVRDAETSTAPLAAAQQSIQL